MYTILYNYALLWTLLAAIFNKEDDIASYTIRSVDDPRALNKVLYIRPPKNIYSFNELVALWEKKIGKTLEKVYVPEEKVLKDIQGQWENMSKSPKMLYMLFLCSFMLSNISIFNIGKEQKVG